MHLVDLARQVASDAILLKQQAGESSVIYMTTTPIELLGSEREARARAFLKYVRDDETIDDVGSVAQRLLPLLHAKLSASRDRGEIR